jgi:hypothetical protein
VQFNVLALKAVDDTIQPNMVVTIKHNGHFVNGRPRKPKITVIRYDVSLEQFKQLQAPNNSINTS